MFLDRAIANSLQTLHSSDLFRTSPRDQPGKPAQVILVGVSANSETGEADTGLEESILHLFGMWFPHDRAAYFELRDASMRDCAHASIEAESQAVQFSESLIGWGKPVFSDCFTQFQIVEDDTSPQISRTLGKR